MIHLIDIEETNTFPDENALAAHLEAKQYSVEALARLRVVSGPLKALHFQLQLRPVEGSAPVEKKRTPKAPKQPDAPVLRAVEDLFLPGVAMTKAKAHTAIPSFGTDTIDAAIDWLTHTGKLTRAAKTYRAAKDAAPGSAP